MAQTVFERREQKYMLTRQQYELLRDLLRGLMKRDENGHYTVSNLYYDTDDYRFIRASIEKPRYKEKLRLRAYGRVTEGSPVFLEQKKKYDGIVYKRREKLSQEEAAAFLAGREIGKDTQILREIGYMLRRNRLSPKICISYEREALVCVNDPALRITFDSGLRFRQSTLQLAQGSWGRAMLEQERILMEIKASGALPVWLVMLLGGLQIYPSSFSKYGFCYEKFIQPRLLAGEVAHSA